MGEAGSGTAGTVVDGGVAAGGGCGGGAGAAGRPVDGAPYAPFGTALGACCVCLQSIARRPRDEQKQSLEKVWAAGSPRCFAK